MSQSDESTTDLGPSEPKENKAEVVGREKRSGSTTRTRKPFVKPNAKPKSSPFQPVVSMTLFFDPPVEKIWDEKPIWSAELCFGEMDEPSKSLLDDFRSSLVAAQNAAFPPRSSPSSAQLQKLAALRTSKPGVKRVAYEKIATRERIASCGSENVPLKILKRTTNGPPKFPFDNKPEAMNLEKEVMHLLERFCLTTDFEYFDSALKLCRKSVVQTYYGVLELVTRGSTNIPDSKSGLLVKFANLLEKYHQSKDSTAKRPKISKSESNRDLKKRCAIQTANGVNCEAENEVVRDQEELERKLATLAFASPLAARKHNENPFVNAYERLLHEIRDLHKDFVWKLASALGGLDQNVFLRRDQSSNRIKLLSGCPIPKVPQENEKKWNELRPFLYREFMTLGYVERIGVKSFKIDSTSSADPTDEYVVGARLDAAVLQFVRAAIVRSTKASPFEGLSSVCQDRTFLSRNLHLLCSSIRDKDKPRTPMLELRNLSKLYSIFYPIFCVTYDAVFNKGYRHGNPWRSAKQQRWLFPEGIRDPLYDRDPAVRLCNNLFKFVVDADFALFKFYFYWSGVRLMTFLGYKIIERIDVDQFDEQVQVAVCGLTAGFHAGMADNVHLLQLARFVIAITTLSERESADKKSFHAACRLLVEYLAVLLRQFNCLCAEKSLVSSVEERGLNDQMFAFLLPIVVLTHWMANSPIFFEYEAWTRRWASSVSFLADLWPEMSTLGNGLEKLNKHGHFKDIELTNLTEKGDLLPELVNSFGISPIFDSVSTIVTTTSTKLSRESLVRLYVVWRNVHSIANHGDYFAFENGKKFVGHSDEKRVLVREPDYVDTPRLLPVPLKEIEDCINNRRKELEAEQAQELADLINMAKADAEKVDNESSKVLVVVEPRYLVIDTNAFIDGLDTILALMHEPGFKILVPSAVISELKGLRNRSVSPNHQDEENAKKVAHEAVRSLQMLETNKRSNCLLLLCSGETMPMDVMFHDVYEGTKPNNDRLIIEAARRFSERVCGRSVRIPRGDVWMFRKVLLVTRDRVMMLLANAYRLPSLDVFKFAEWAGLPVR